MVKGRGYGHVKLAGGKGVVTAALVLLLGLAIGPVSAGGAATQGKAGAANTDIARTVMALKAFTVDSLDTDIPQGARPLLTTLKHQARDLILATLDSIKPDTGKDLDRVGKALATELGRQRVLVERAVATGAVKPPPEPEDREMGQFTYGQIPKIAVKAVPGHPELIAATTTVEINCGSDSSFYLFRKHTGTWRDYLPWEKSRKWDLVLAQEANGYKDVGGGQGDFYYAFSSLSFKGEPFVLVTNTIPWCTSAWNAIHYRVLRPGKSAYEPKVLLDQERTLYLGTDRDPVVTMLRKGFRIEFTTSQGLDHDALNRVCIASYEVSGDRVKRLPPFASREEDFLDEWLGMPWDEAARWTTPAMSAELRKWHETFNEQRRPGHKIRFSTEFVFDRCSCQLSSGQWLVGVAFQKGAEDKYLPSGIPKEIYFKITKKGKDFFVTGVSNRNAGSCPRKVHRES